MTRRDKIFVDITPLLDYSWTGIAMVAKYLARYFLDHHPENTVFFAGNHVISPNFVAVAISESPGGYLSNLVEAGVAKLGTVAEEVAQCKTSYGIFTNIKPFHNFFDRDLVIVYDLSPILMPEMHQDWAVRMYCEGLLRDTAASDLVCCISEATRRDVVTYLPVAEEKTFVAYPGSDWGSDIIPPAKARGPGDRPYVVVIGTVEPRKNLALIAQFMETYPEICKNFVFIFVGRSGWGDKFQTVFRDILADPVLRHSILYTEYLPEIDKRRLTAGAVCAIYPSLFEGFGLPVLECLSIGCPILLSRSSSLVEFALPDQLYFDPFSLDELYDSFSYLIQLSDQARTDLCTDLVERSRPFTWKAFGDGVVSKLMSPFEQPSQNISPMAVSRRKAIRQTKQVQVG